LLDFAIDQLAEILVHGSNEQRHIVLTRLAEDGVVPEWKAAKLVRLVPASRH
jgi:hypothetical protein